MTPFLRKRDSSLLGLLRATRDLFQSRLLEAIEDSAVQMIFKTIFEINNIQTVVWW